ncbi:MAG: DUF4149 domain-containing protein [Hydrogenophilaceae bacterium]|nr:DUF4149 domain-containing protein [Hydrogenophilaceae bacterium]
MKNFADGLASALLVLWVGGLWAIGYIAAPTLFAQLSDRQLAGNLAGELFKWIAWVGIIAGTYLLLFRLGRQGFQALKQAYFWIVLVMLLLTLGQHFGIQPVMQALKDQAMPQAVMESAFRSRFAAWHGVSSIVYLIESVLGLILVWR